MKPYNIDIRKNFSKMIKQIMKTDFDLLVLTGDLCFMVGEEQIYIWIKKVLDKLNKPYLILSGNHDNPDLIRKIFGYEGEGDIFYSHKTDYGKLLILDSTSAIVSKTQLDWMESECKDENQNILLFVHHPIYLAGCKFMDSKHSIKNSDEILASIDNCISKPKHIFCGHYHSERSIFLRDYSLHISPSSSYIQIESETENFQSLGSRQGWRWIHWDEQRLETFVRYYEL